MLGWFFDTFILEIFSLKRQKGLRLELHDQLIRNAAEILVCIGCMKDQENAPGMTWLSGCFKRKLRTLSNVTRKISRVKLTKNPEKLGGKFVLKGIKGIKIVKNLKRVCFFKHGLFSRAPYGTHLSKSACVTKSHLIYLT